MKNHNYITIQGWMINELLLKGNELILFAMIYGFCQDNESEFTGSLSYICKALSCSRNTGIKTIGKLVDSELLVKTVNVINQVTFNKYKIHGSVVQKMNGGSAKVARGGSAKVAPNNTSLDINKNNRVKSEIDYTQEIEILKSVSNLFDKKYYDTKPKQNKWLEEVRKLITIDKEKPEDIIAVIKFAKDDDFWNKNLLSISALRKKNGAGVMKYDSIKAKMPNQPKQSNVVYKNGIKPAKPDDIRDMLGDDYTYQKNVIEGKSEYVEYDELIYIVRSDEKGKYIITPNGKLYI